MGKMVYISEDEGERLFESIFSGEYKFITKLIGTDIQTGQPAKGAYALFEDLARKDIDDYAKKTAAEKNIKLSKIEIWTLQPEMIKESPWEDKEEK